MNKKKMVVFAAGAASAVLLAGCGSKLSAASVQKNPVSAIRAGSEMTQKAWGMDNQYLTELSKKVAEKGTVEVKGKIRDYEINNTLYIDGKKSVDEFSAELEGQTLDFGLGIDGSYLSVKSTALFGDSSYYGLDIAKFIEEGSDSTVSALFGLDDDFFKSMQEVKESFENENDSEEISLAKKAEEVKEDCWNILSEQAYEVKEEKATIAGKEVDAVIVSTEYDETLAEKVLDKVKAISELYETALGEVETEDVDGTIVWKLNKKTGALMEVDITSVEKEVETNASVVYGAEPETATELSVTLDGKTNADGPLKMNAVVTRGKEGKTQTLGIAADFTSAEGTGEVDAKFELNTDSKEFTLTADVDGGEENETLIVSGDLTMEKEEFTLHVTNIKLNDVAVDCDLLFSMKEGAEMPADVSSKNLMEMDEEELMNFAVGPIQAISSLIDGMGGEIEDGYDYEYDDDTSLENDNVCAFCLEEGTVEIEYLGNTYIFCEEHAAEMREIIDGNYCDGCWFEMEPDALTEVEIDGITYRLCEDCLPYYVQ